MEHQGNGQGPNSPGLPSNVVPHVQNQGNIQNPGIVQNQGFVRHPGLAPDAGHLQQQPVMHNPGMVHNYDYPPYQANHPGMIPNVRMMFHPQNGPNQGNVPNPGINQNHRMMQNQGMIYNQRPMQSNPGMYNPPNIFNAQMMPMRNLVMLQYPGAMLNPRDAENQMQRIQNPRFNPIPAVMHHNPRNMHIGGNVQNPGMMPNQANMHNPVNMQNPMIRPNPNQNSIRHPANMQNPAIGPSPGNVNHQPNMHNHSHEAINQPQHPPPNMVHPQAAPPPRRVPPHGFHYGNCLIHPSNRHIFYKPPEKDEGPKDDKPSHEQFYANGQGRFANRNQQSSAENEIRDYSEINTIATSFYGNGMNRPLSPYTAGNSKVSDPKANKPSPKKDSEASIKSNAASCYENVEPHANTPVSNPNTPNSSAEMSIEELMQMPAGPSRNLRHLIAIARKNVEEPEGLPAEKRPKLSESSPVPSETKSPKSFIKDQIESRSPRPAEIASTSHASSSSNSLSASTSRPLSKEVLKPKSIASKEADASHREQESCTSSDENDESDSNEESSEDETEAYHRKLPMSKLTDEMIIATDPEYKIVADAINSLSSYVQNNSADEGFMEDVFEYIENDMEADRSAEQTIRGEGPVHVVRASVSILSTVLHRIGGENESEESMRNVLSLLENYPQTDRNTTAY